MHRVLKPKPEDAGVYERQLDLNFHGARRMLEAILPDMARRGYGRIVNVASSAGLVGYANLTAYCASKFALVGYTLALAKELAEDRRGGQRRVPALRREPDDRRYSADYARAPTRARRSGAPGSPRRNPAGGWSRSRSARTPCGRRCSRTARA
jgi:NAD(P)-dependent dehydrogenase (short-subunit alcohol dehydrogenase family)